LKKHVLVTAAALLGFVLPVLSEAQGGPVIRYTVIPDPSGVRVRVEAAVRLQNASAYLRDFGQVESIRWLVNGVDVKVKADRQGDVLFFNGLPASGDALAVYTLNCVTVPRPGYRKRLMGSSSFVLAREGLFLGLVSRDLIDVDVRWDLPAGWRLVLGRDGGQRFGDTQRTLWVAGKIAEATTTRAGTQALTVSVLEGASSPSVTKTLRALVSIFDYASTNYGPLAERDCGLAIFPRGGLGGGTALGQTLASDDDPLTIAHEMLHWWTNPGTPAWFREGVHSYISLKLLAESTSMDAATFEAFLRGFVEERGRVVQREGRVSSLADSSDAYERNQGGGDIYAYAVLFAFKLDQNIRSRNPASSLERVFAEVCRSRPGGGGRPARPKTDDIIGLIKDITGYEAELYFRKYFYEKVENVEDLLKGSAPGRSSGGRFVDESQIIPDRHIARD
jgi:hypothetical protein